MNRTGDRLSAQMLISILLCLVAAEGFQGAQTQAPMRPAYPSLEANKEYQAGNYLAPIVEFRTRRKEFLDPAATGSAVNNIPLRGLYLQTYGTFAAEVGNYREALAAFDEDAGAALSAAKNLDAQKAELNACKPVDAIATIKQMADSERAIFINEAHHVPQHRAFTLSLLRALWEKGFRYFAAETLSSQDEERHQRRYPARSKTGWYSNEPLYGDVIRTALQLGYKTVAYEYEGERKPGENFQQLRDKGQAQNLYDRIFKNDPQAKVIVHAGYAHVYEKATTSWSPMALYFRELTGINPLTVEQTEMCERSAAKFESPVYAFATERWKIEKPTLFRLPGGGYFVGGSLNGFVDVQIFSPRSQYRNERPTWLLMNGARSYHQVALADLQPDALYLVQARWANEGEDGVPIDQIEVSGSAKRATLVLPKGEFIIALKDQTGRPIRSYRHKAK